ncbi:hypothetical protein ABMA27_004038 [Loxostege sticticalis]|uniref:Gustatory receptor n=1 Tax=Loxostege sticticalis TaxID=481309 RepID=A0ABR3HR81_LOXSC
MYQYREIVFSKYIDRDFEAMLKPLIYVQNIFLFPVYRIKNDFITPNIINQKTVLISFTMYMTKKFDLSVIYASRMIHLTRRNLELWNLELRKITSLPIEDLKKTHPEFYWRTMLKRYLEIMETLKFIEKCFRKSILFYIIDTFLHSLPYIERSVGYSKDLFVGKKQLRILRDALPVVVSFGWLLKNLSLLVTLCIECEKMYLSLRETRVVCARLTAERSCSEQRKEKIKNIQTLNRCEFTKFSACGLFDIDANFFMSFIGTIHQLAQKTYEKNYFLHLVCIYFNVHSTRTSAIHNLDSWTFKLQLRTELSTRSGKRSRNSKVYWKMIYQIYLEIEETVKYINKCFDKAKLIILRDVLPVVDAFGWLLKNLILLATLCFECEKMYLSVRETRVVCARLTAEQSCSEVIKEKIKNIQMLNRSEFTKFNACGWFYIDANFFMSFIGTIAAYTFVILQCYLL